MKTKALISFTVTAKLICAFVFAYAKSWFSHDAAQIWQRIEPVPYELRDYILAKVELLKPVLLRKYLGSNWAWIEGQMTRKLTVFLFLIGWGITPNQIVLRLLMVCAMLVLGYF